MHSAEALTALLLKLHSGEEYPDQQLHIFLWYGEIPVCHLKKFRESLIQVAKYEVISVSKIQNFRYTHSSSEMIRTFDNNDFVAIECIQLPPNCSLKIECEAL